MPKVNEFWDCYGQHSHRWLECKKCKLNKKCWLTTMIDLQKIKNVPKRIKEKITGKIYD
jgi:hypothetical protein